LRASSTAGRNKRELLDAKRNRKSELLSNEQLALLAALWQENRCEQGGGRQPKVHASAETLRTLPQTGSPGRFSGKRGSDVGQAEKGQFSK
jgi:hypothetical protein